jgi:hypothetical protein
MMMRRFVLSFPLVLAAAASCAGAQSVASAPAPGESVRGAEDVIRAMHDRYAGKWYRTLSFTQETSRVLPNDSVRVETWREWALIPGRLRIEMGPTEAGNGAIYARDSLFRFRAGQRTGATAERNPLALLGFDAYRQDAAITLQVLREEGFDLSRFHEDTWQGRPAYVVGALAGDSTSKQFWVDRERLVFVRLLEPAAGDGTRVQDIRFLDYRPIGSAWVAPRVELWAGGRRLFWEDYSDIRVDEALPAALWDPARWTTAHHPQP